MGLSHTTVFPFAHSVTATSMSIIINKPCLFICCFVCWIVNKLVVAKQNLFYPNIWFIKSSVLLGMTYLSLASSDLPYPISFSRACASWSGHDVGLAPQRMPFRRVMTSEALAPSTSLAIPVVLPGQPPMNCRLCTRCSSSISNFIYLEHVPVVSNIASFIFLLIKRIKEDFRE